MDKYTSPPCSACGEHDALEAKMEQNMANNSKEHSIILTKIETLVTNMKWMKVIGSWIVFSLLGYLLALAVFIATSDFASKADIENLTTEVHDGEKLHYRNERIITKIESELDTILTHV